MNVLITLIVVIITGWAIMKKIKPQTVLVIAGLFLMLYAYFFGYKTEFVTAKQSTGLPIFDMFAYIRYTLAKDIAGLGLTIMVGAGFAKYMDYIGASSRMVDVCIGPLKKLNAPYIVNAMGFATCMILSLAIQSASALATLTMVTVYPIIRRLGISPAAAASVVATGHLLDLGPAAATSILISNVANVSITKLFVEHQLPVYFISGVIATIAHYFWQKHLDRKEGLMNQEFTETVSGDSNASVSMPGPYGYLILPCLPLFFILTFSEYGYSAIRLDIITAMLISFAIAMVCEIFRYKDFKKVAASINEFFGGMGKMFGVTVTLIVAAEVFAYGITATGTIDILIDATKNSGLGINAITLGICALIIGVSIVTGSGVAAMYSFAPLIPNFASGIGADPLIILHAMQNAASLGRQLSPVAAVIVIVAGLAGVSTVDLVKRNSVPILISMVVSAVAILMMY